MTPNYNTAKAKAIETILKYNLDPAKADPLQVLSQLPNVLLMPFDTDFVYIDPSFENTFTTEQDSLTMVNKNGDNLQYIVIYNKALPPYRLRLALAQELGHVILNHDGKTSEEIWSEESLAFALHFMFPVKLLTQTGEQKKTIYYRPVCGSLLWEMKSICTFDSIDSMKVYVAEEKNKHARYIGDSDRYYPCDVQLLDPRPKDNITGWKNCFDIVLNGKTVGYCGE